MKKVILTICLLFFPLLVKAESKDFYVESIELENINGNAVELNEATADGTKINLDLKFYDPGDSIDYKLLIKNNTKEDCTFDEDSLKLNTDYISYELIYEDESNIVKSNEEKDVILRIQYDNKVPEDKLVNDAFQDTDNVILNISSISSEFLNPNTKTGLAVIVLLSLSLIVFIITNKKQKVIKYVVLIMCILPLYVLALQKYTIKVETKVQIDGKEAYFLPGSEVNVIMKKLAGTDTFENNYDTVDNNIISIKNSSIVPDESNKQDNNIVSTDESPYPIYMWYEEGTIYWWSEDKSPQTNEDASYMFRRLSGLVDIDGLENFDTGITDNMTGMFSGKSVPEAMHLTSLESLKKWNVSNVTNMTSMFDANVDLESLHGLENWDTHNVETLYKTFARLYSLKDLDPLNNWNTSNVTNMMGTFGNQYSLLDLSGLENWDISNVLYINHLFDNNVSLTTLSGLEKWDTSNLTDMTGAFHNCAGLEDASAISNWDVSNVENMSYLFNISHDVHSSIKYSSLAQLDIRKWNMAKVKNYDYFMESLRYVSTEFTLRSTVVESSYGMLMDCANQGGKITINYTVETENIVNQILETISPGTNIELILIDE